MSERGSFVTQYIYCSRCLEICKQHLLMRDKYLNSVVVPPWQNGGMEMPIIAGKIGGLGPGDDMNLMEDIRFKLDKELCHNVRIAVLPDNGADYFLICGPD